MTAIKKAGDSIQRRFAANRTKGRKVCKNGVYLIIGGLSGIGWIISAFLYANHGASVIIAGRSKMTADMEEKLDSIRYDGASISYIQADMSDKRQVIKLAEKFVLIFPKSTGSFTVQAC